MTTGGRGRPSRARSIRRDPARSVLLTAGVTTVLSLGATACGGSDGQSRSTDRAVPLAPHRHRRPSTSSTTTEPAARPRSLRRPPPQRRCPSAPGGAHVDPLGHRGASRSPPKRPRAGYDRASFRYGVDDDHDRCFTRCEILAGQRYASLPGLPDGGWLSSYDGYSTPNPDELEIDHVVPLAEAWDSGVGGWDEARRREFANDPLELLAVSRAMNRSKSDDDPAEWQPPNRAGLVSVRRAVDVGEVEVRPHGRPGRGAGAHQHGGGMSVRSAGVTGDLGPNRTRSSSRY